MGQQNKMVFLKTEEEIEIMRLSALLVSDTLAFVAETIRPGLSALDLDKKAEEFIRDNKGVPAFKGFNGFPASLCISLNEAVVHGIPDNRSFNEGDIISVDCGVCMNGFYGDSAFTFALLPVPETHVQLLNVTRESLKLGIANCIPGNRIGDISHAIQEYTEVKHKYGVVRELVGHGIGRNLHEAPDVPNYGKPGKGTLLKEGMVLAIEPMINLGTYKVKQLKDGWTIVTGDKLPSAHFEHTVAIKKEGPDVLSDDIRVLTKLKKNDFLLKFE